ncbi:MAG: Outer membrane protein TolC [Candidatus Electronema aureum]|uniref:Outer membrane protein TolC n=1 Tax=Candidatus Electronema aureum TaxID=2005002 RepID=A0A521G1C8_9BACT|nr:MAG: Outer membrane protein TolC [Candidatus Electronema aureum]
MKRITFALLAGCLMLTPPAWGKKTKEKPKPVEEQAIAAEPVAPPPVKTKMLELPEAQRIALQGNPGIGAAQARIEQAKAKIKQVIASQQPSVDVVANLGAQSDQEGEISENSSLGLQASWLLFDGYARKFQQEQAEYGEKSSAAAKRNSQRLLIAAVADAFFNAQLAKTSIEIAAGDQEFYEQQLKDAQHRFQAGTGSWGDVLNIRVQVNSAKNSVISAQRQHEAARYGLSALLGVEDSALPELSELDKKFNPPDDSMAVNTETLISEALKNRPDVKKLTLQIKGAEAGVQQAEAQNSPKVQVKGQAGAVSQKNLFPESDDIGASVGLSLSWNLYSGGAVEAAAMEARQAKREAAYGYADLRNSITAEIKQDAALLVAAAKLVRLQQESVDLVKENRKLAQSEYEAGASSLVRLNEAQRDLTTTYGRLAQAVVAYHQARHQLLAAAGKNLEPFTDLLEVQVKTPKVE